MARPAGLEPATLCLEGRCSILMSYGGIGFQDSGRAALSPLHIYGAKDNYFNPAWQQEIGFFIAPSGMLS